jgi:hypothetical protein
VSKKKQPNTGRRTSISDTNPKSQLCYVWPLGSVVAQGCHAAVAAVWAHREHPDTAAYCGPDNLDRMHKACSTVCVTRHPQAFDLHFNIVFLVLLINI